MPRYFLRGGRERQNTNIERQGPPDFVCYKTRSPSGLWVTGYAMPTDYTPSFYIPAFDGPRDKHFVPIFIENKKILGGGGAREIYNKLGVSFTSSQRDIKRGMPIYSTTGPDLNINVEGVVDASNFEKFLQILRADSWQFIQVNP